MNQNQKNGQELNGLQSEQEFANANSTNLSDMLNDLNSKPPTVIVNKSMVSKNEDVNQPVKQETKGLEDVSKYQEQIDRLYQTNIDKEWSFIDKWKNRSMFDQVQEVKKDLFKTSADYRLKFYKTQLDTRLEYLNEKCNAGLKMVKGHYRHQVSSFLMAKMEELSFQVRDRQFAFLDMMKGKYAYAETLIGYPSMQQRYLSSVFEEEGNYLKFLDGLLDKFQSIVDEELKKYN